MKSFNYTALNHKGDTVEGLLSAESEVYAITKLRARGLYPTTVKELECKTAVSNRPEHPSRTYVRELKSTTKMFLLGLMLGGLCGLALGILLTTIP